MVGQTVSHYQIVEKLGGGGMGVVYKAIDTRLNRFVALKFLPPELTKDKEANDRFRQEAQAASALDHPNICTIHEIDETPDRELFLTMAYYDGETLKKRIERGSISTATALDIAIQMAQALSRAHQSGLVHRDVKPANTMITSNGLVKIVDFGLAKLAGRSDLTRTGTTLGTIAYMAPEQIRGTHADARADVWALGVVLYEMLAGSRPFNGKDDLAIVGSILESTPTAIGKLRLDLPPGLERVVSRAMERSLPARYPSASELLADLTACQTTMSGHGPRGADVLGWLRRPAVAFGAAAVLIVAAVPAVGAYRRGARARWARNEGVPQIMRLAGAADFAGAFALAKDVDRAIPDDPILVGLWPQISAVATLATDPPDADVFMQPYDTTSDAWEPLGRTPLKNVKLPRGVLRIRIEKPGYQPLALASMNPGAVLGNLAGPRRPAPITMPLLPIGKTPDMVPVPGGAYPVGLSGFNSEVSVGLDSFLIDRDEVTNRAFKRFIDRGGYTTSEYWRELAAPSVFVDSTSRPGPATWELGQYPSGQDDYPVGGVSWSEAVAYCRSEGKTLPTIYHWARAALSPVEIGSPVAPSIIPVSNFGGKGPAPVGSTRAIGPYGTHDMAGNVREWVWNETADRRRWILGGQWGDPGYLFVVPNSLPPDDRSISNGFRCARFADGAAIPGRLLGRVDTYSRDNRAAKAVSDEVFDVFKRQMAYLKSPLNARVESRDTSRPEWVREKISFDTGYEAGRVNAYLFLPGDAKPPYQLVVVFPGVPIGPGSSETTQPSPAYDYIIKSGRAVVLPIYKGYLERWDPFLALQGEEYLRTFRTRMAQWRQDLGNTLDVLSTRPDIDPTRIAFLGLSFGGSTAFPLIVLEDRIKTAVLAPSGFTYRLLPPEADALNYAGRVKIPVLMMGGRHDYIFPLETSQKPMFEKLGTAAEHKRHVVFDAGHTNFPRSEMIREALGWLDRYLGPMRTTAASQTQ